MTYRLIIAIISTLVIACSNRSEEKHTNPTPSQALLDLRGSTLQKLLQNSERGGWPASDECDGALWMGMAVRAGMENIEATASIQPDGRPTRLHNKDCMPGNTGSQVECIFDAPCMGGSASTISNDMITGILLAFIYNKDMESIHKLYQYGERNSWVMGYPVSMLSRVYLRPNGRTIMARALYKFSNGEINYDLYRVLPIIYSTLVEDYEIQLQALGLIIAKDLEYFGATEQLIANEIANNNPNDALVQAVAGRYQIASDLITSPDYVIPSYVRGHPNYAHVHILLVSQLIIEGLEFQSK